MPDDQFVVQPMVLGGEVGGATVIPGRLARDVMDRLPASREFGPDGRGDRRVVKAAKRQLRADLKMMFVCNGYCCRGHVIVASEDCGGLRIKR